MSRRRCDGLPLDRIGSLYGSLDPDVLQDNIPRKYAELSHRNTHNQTSLTLMYCNRLLCITSAGARPITECDWSAEPALLAEHSPTYHSGYVPCDLPIELRYLPL